MDMTGLCPKYLNIKRSGFIVMSLGILIWPWKILTSAKAVIVFGNGWGCFCSSQTGIIIAKYFIIYRRKMLLKDLYIDSEESIYWFYNGFDWRSILSFFIGTVFLIPGLAWDTQGRSNGFWTWMYQISYLSGIIISMTSEIALHTLFPQKDIKPSTKVEDVFNEDGSRIESAEKIEGVTVEVVETVSIENKSKMS
jgi:NCS1 family nucleobase:cation symporter-1